MPQAPDAAEKPLVSLSLLDRVRKCGKVFFNKTTICLPSNALNPQNKAKTADGTVCGGCGVTFNSTLWGNESYMKKRGNICGILLLIIVEILLMGACIKSGSLTATARDTSQSNSETQIAMYQSK